MRDYRLHLEPEVRRENENTEKTLGAVRNELLRQLQDLRGAPGVQMQEVPPEFRIVRDETANMDVDPTVSGGGDSVMMDGILGASAANAGLEGANDGGRGDDVRVKGPGRTSKGKGDGVRQTHHAEYYDDVD